ncbi:hypothetical protein PIB30_017988 [Stylosanthes scabra]|uniref:Uncharacterized protein n=1 Tax=Stylosanthes scabra TaxID=79078 RepID=A0ABU6UAX8_9FABA|nr:hypothetical protein [Stylosanthes scabra]
MNETEERFKRQQNRSSQISKYRSRKSKKISTFSITNFKLQSVANHFERGEIVTPGKDSTSATLTVESSESVFDCGEVNGHAKSSVEVGAVATGKVDDIYLEPEEERVTRPPPNPRHLHSHVAAFGSVDDVAYLNNESDRVASLTNGGRVEDCA